MDNRSESQSNKFRDEDRSLSRRRRDKSSRGLSKSKTVALTSVKDSDRNDVTSHVSFDTQKEIVTSERP